MRRARRYRRTGTVAHAPCLSAGRKRHPCLRGRFFSLSPRWAASCSSIEYKTSARFHRKAPVTVAYGGFCCLALHLRGACRQLRAVPYSRCFLRFLERYPFWKHKPRRMQQRGSLGNLAGHILCIQCISSSAKPMFSAGVSTGIRVREWLHSKRRRLMVEMPWFDGIITLTRRSGHLWQDFGL